MKLSDWELIGSITISLGLVALMTGTASLFVLHIVLTTAVSEVYSCFLYFPLKWQFFALQPAMPQVVDENEIQADDIHLKLLTPAALPAEDNTLPPEDNPIIEEPVRIRSAIPLDEVFQRYREDPPIRSSPRIGKGVPPLRYAEQEAYKRFEPKTTPVSPRRAKKP